MAGAREAFFNGVPAVSVSYDWYVYACLMIKYGFVECQILSICKWMPNLLNFELYKLLGQVLVFCFCKVVVFCFFDLL